MFQWDKSVNAIDVPASQVVHLFRSMREVQLALPGVPAQQASAFLCQYQVEDQVGTVAVFHLQKSHVLAFYFSDPRVVPKQKTDSMLDQALNFVESMGFLLTDQDIHLLDEKDQEMLWASLPLKAGLPEKETEPAVTVPLEAQEKKSAAKVVDPVVKTVPKTEEKVSEETKTKEVKSATTSVDLEKEEPTAKSDAAENVDDLLAAVEAMRAKRPGLRARKLPPSTEEMARRRMQLRETVGRILASL